MDLAAFIDVARVSSFTTGTVITVDGGVSVSSPLPTES
jgi:hypothetical protein